MDGNGDMTHEDQLILVLLVEIEAFSEEEEEKEKETHQIMMKRKAEVK